MVETRDELILLLNEAAQVEHSLTCQYLFAALSLKRDVSEGVTQEQLIRINDWEQIILLVARQEMEHLGLVGNLLTAIGAAPYLNKPNFPQPKTYLPRPMVLEKFSEETVKRFVCFERPDHISPEDGFCDEPLNAAEKAATLLVEKTPQPQRFPTIGALYLAIRETFERIPLDDRDLFTGPPNAQVGGPALQYEFPRSIAFQPGVFDVYMYPVTDRKSALRAIDLILEQGEGTPKSLPQSEFSHYRRFLAILAELQRMRQGDPNFEPARPVVPNPRLYGPPAPRQVTGVTVVTNPLTRRALDLFNDAYVTLLLILTRYFAHTDETEAEIKGLLYTFYPLMTTVLRPLGDLLTRMPAGDDTQPECAGPSFETDTTLQLLPHKRSAWLYLHGKLETMARDCLALSREPGVSPRIAFLAENMDYIARKFRSLMDLG